MRGGFLLLMLLLAGALGAWAIVSPPHPDLAAWPGGPHAAMPIAVVTGVAFLIGGGLAIAAGLATQSLPDRGTIAGCAAVYLAVLVALTATRGDRAVLGTMLVAPAAIAVLAGLGWVLYRAIQNDHPLVWIYVLAGAAGLVLLVAVVQRDASPVQMALTLALGLGTLRTAHIALGMIRDRQPVEMRTRAGGLGGGAGGWTMSPAAGALLLAAILAAATIGLAGVIRPSTPPSTGNQQSSTTAGSDTPHPAADKPGAAPTGTAPTGAAEKK